MSQRMFVTSALVAAITLLCPFSAFGQAPAHANDMAGDVPILEAPPIDRAALLAEDELTPAGPARVAVVQPFSLDSRWQGVSAALEDGSRLWTARIRSPGAGWMRLVIDDWNPPGNSTLIVHDPAQPDTSRRVLSPTRSLGDDYWSPILFSNEIVLEYRTDADVDADAEYAALRMSRIVCGYRGFSSSVLAADDAAGTRGDGPRDGEPLPCNSDPTCWTQSAPHYEGIGLWLQCDGGGCTQCSGTLLNREYVISEPLPPLNYGDDAALFLTASHCGATSSNLNTVVVVFRFHTDNCNSTPPDFNTLPQTRAIAMLVNLPNVGIQLLGLERLGIPFTRNVFSVDSWPTPFFSTSEAFTIHHPLGSYMRLADAIKTGNIDNRPARQPDGSCASADNYLVRFDFFERVEAGSDGAPVFRYSPDHEYQPIMAVLSCNLTGPPNCTDANSYSAARLDQAAGPMIPYRFPLETVYVDRTYLGTERGTENEPMRSVARGSFVVRRLFANPTMRFSSGSYAERVVIDSRCTLRLAAPGASAVIGQ